ncbi:MAG: CBS domain-containing protein [Candidatus Hatepunaea meridiana]|nr:CBS domain-containing protein [Candidatus Hatepunaea meridiana]
MIPLDEYPHVDYRVTLRQAIEVIENGDIEIKGKKSLPRAILVFDENKNLLGIARRRDILRGLEPDFLKTMALSYRKKLFDIETDPNLVELSSGRLAKAIQVLAERPISEVMSPVVATLRNDDHLAKIIFIMLNRDQALLPVIKDRKVVGVVRSVDVFNEIARIVL